MSTGHHYLDFSIGLIIFMVIFWSVYSVIGKPARRQRVNPVKIDSSQKGERGRR